MVRNGKPHIQKLCGMREVLLEHFMGIVMSTCPFHRDMEYVRKVKRNG